MQGQPQPTADTGPYKPAKMNTIPLEVFEIILGNVTSPRDLRALRAVNRSFKDICTPFAFRTISIHNSLKSADGIASILDNLLSLYVQEIQLLIDLCSSCMYPTRPNTVHILTPPFGQPQCTPPYYQGYKNTSLASPTSHPSQPSTSYSPTRVYPPRINTQTRRFSATSNTKPSAPSGLRARLYCTHSPYPTPPAATYKSHPTPLQAVPHRSHFPLHQQ